MSGHVGIIANDAGRYTMFSVCVTRLAMPVNTAILWKLTSDRVIGRNMVVEEALNVGSEWVLFLDDDQAFAPDLLMRLLAHNQPVVGALYLQRQPPFAPIAYAHRDEQGLYYPIQLNDVPPSGLAEVVACGTGGMLIRAEVLRQMTYPWFVSGVASEDMIFCDRVREMGAPIRVDTGVRMGHLSMASVWPSHDGTDWAVGFQLADGFSLAVPISA